MKIVVFRSDKQQSPTLRIVGIPVMMLPTAENKKQIVNFILLASAKLVNLEYDVTDWDNRVPENSSFVRIILEKEDLIVQCNISKDKAISLLIDCLLTLNNSNRTVSFCF